MQIFALIPAGGKSVRMGRSKLDLPLGDRTVLEHVLVALRQACLTEILVVLAPHGDELISIADRAGASFVRLTEETPDMRATIEHGLTWLTERWRPKPEDGLLLCPADHPTLDTRVVTKLIDQASAKRDAGSTASIWVPTFEGKRGHPTLVKWHHLKGIRAMPAGRGLNRYFREHAAETEEVPWNSPEILLDLDTPADYERLRVRFESR